MENTMAGLPWQVMLFTPTCSVVSHGKKHDLPLLARLMAKIVAINLAIIFATNLAI